MNKLEHEAALELAEAEIAWWTRSASSIKSEYGTLLANAYIDLLAERQMLMAVAETAQSALGINCLDYRGADKGCKHCLTAKAIAAWRKG